MSPFLSAHSANGLFIKSGSSANWTPHRTRSSTANVTNGFLEKPLWLFKYISVALGVGVRVIGEQFCFGRLLEHLWLLGFALVLLPGVPHPSPSVQTQSNLILSRYMVQLIRGLPLFLLSHPPYRLPWAHPAGTLLGWTTRKDACPIHS